METETREIKPPSDEERALIETADREARRQTREELVYQHGGRSYYADLVLADFDAVRLPPRNGKNLHIFLFEPMISRWPMRPDFSRTGPDRVGDCPTYALAT